METRRAAASWLSAKNIPVDGWHRPGGNSGWSRTGTRSAPGAHASGSCRVDYGFTSVSKTRTFFHDALFSSMNWVWRG